METTRDEAVRAWRLAEERLYPVVLVRPDLYEPYVHLVRAIANQLRDAVTEEALLDAYATGRSSAADAATGAGIALHAEMDLGLARDAAFCLRHGELVGELQRAEGRRRLEHARSAGEEWVTVFEEGAPGLRPPRRTVEMHVPSGRAIHTYVEVGVDTGRPIFGVELIRLDPMTGDWITDVDPVGREELEDPEAWRQRIDTLRTTGARPPGRTTTGEETHGQGPAPGH